MRQLRSTLIRNTPSFLSRPLHYVPFSIKKEIITQLLQWQFKQLLDEDELDFLDGHWLRMEVTDLELVWFTTLKNNRIVVSDYEAADVFFYGNTNDLILVSMRKEDPDTLFFQRRLMVEGDTELGLHVKNMIDSLDFEAMPKSLRFVLLQLSDMILDTQNEC